MYIGVMPNDEQMHPKTKQGQNFDIDCKIIELRVEFCL